MRSCKSRIVLDAKVALASGTNFLRPLLFLLFLETFHRVGPSKRSYPLVNIQKAIENGPVEIVDFPMKKAWWIFPWLCKRRNQAG